MSLLLALVVGALAVAERPHCSKSSCSEDPVTESVHYLSLLQTSAVVRHVSGRSVVAVVKSSDGSFKFAGVRSALLGLGVAVANVTVRIAACWQAQRSVHLSWLHTLHSPSFAVAGEQQVSTLELGGQVFTTAGADVVPVIMILSFCALVALIVIMCLVCEKYLDPKFHPGSGDERHMRLPHSRGFVTSSPPQQVPLATDAPPSSPNLSQQSACSSRSDVGVPYSAGNLASPGMQGRYSSSSSLSLGSKPPADPPPAICPSLVLSVEAGFAIPVKIGEGCFDILGLAGERLLYAAMRLAPNRVGRTIEMYMVTSSGPRAVARCEPLRERAASLSRTHMELRDHGDNVYGQLERVSTGKYRLLYGSSIVMIINAEHDFSQIIVRTPSGGTLATAALCREGSLFYTFEHHEVWVNPGVDSILVLICLLAVVLLEPW